MLHKWHESPNSIDNDFFFVLGKFDSADTSAEELEQIQNDLRQFLAYINLEIELSPETLSLVSYIDPQLPLASSRYRSVLEKDFDADAAVEEYGHCID